MEQVNQVKMQNMREYQPKVNYESNITLSSDKTFDDKTVNTTAGPAKLRLCYVNQTTDNYQAFLDECHDKDEANSTVWILVSNVGTKQDRNVDVLKNVANHSDSRVQALIMTSDGYPRPLDA